MDELDHNLLDAWHRVFERCKADPAEARRRYERTLPGTTLDRPVRAWTVAIRSSDTRINDIAGVIKAADGIGGLGDRDPVDHNGDGVRPPMPTSSGARPPMPSAALGAGDDPVRAQAAHEIVLDGWALQQLGGAVEIPYPGLPIDEAAKKLGKHKEAMRSWMSPRPGRTRAARAESAKGVGYDDENMWFQEHPPTEQHPLGVRYVPQGAIGRHFGMETPVVWSDRALDPGAGKGRPPARWWGSLWKSMAENIPVEFEQVVERVPRFVPYPEIDGVKRPRFRGWWWACPGLLGKTCGRQVSVLYAPLPVWTVGNYFGLTDGLQIEGLAGQWFPGVMDRWAGRRTLACERCWKIRRTSFVDHRGWNELISHLSGGLLFGQEVNKPAHFQYERRQIYRPRSNRNKPHQQAPTQMQSKAAANGSTPVQA